VAKGEQTLAKSMGKGRHDKNHINGPCVESCLGGFDMTPVGR
jgi:hypothetical protein